MPHLRLRNKNNSFLFVSQTGCLLPLFIILNLFFGWLFLTLLQWVVIEALLVLTFIIKSFILTKKIRSGYSGHDKIIDVKGEVIRDNKDQGQLKD